MAHQTVLGPFAPSAVSADEFKHAFRHHASGVAVVTADDGNGPVAMTVSSVFSVSAEPPALVFSLSAGSSATPHVLAAGSVVVHLLAPEDAAIAKRAASHGVDRFGPDVAWERLETGEPVYSSVHTWLRGEIIEEVVIGGSVVVVVLITQTHLGEASDRPLLYHNRRWASIAESDYFEV